MLTTDSSKLLWLLGAVVAVLIAFWYYRNTFFLTPERKQLRAFLIATRALVLFVIYFLCLSPFLSYYQKKDLPPELLLLVDNSSSMSINGLTADSLGSLIAEVKAGLSEQVDVNVKTFDQIFRTSDSLSLQGLKTDFQEALDGARSWSEGRNLTGIVLCSDGIVNAGSKNRLGQVLDVPIYSLATGDTVRKKDVFLRSFYHNDKTLLGNEFPLKVEGVCTGLRGQKIQVEFFMNGQKKGEEILVPQKDVQAFTIDKKLLADSIGTGSLKVKVLPVKDEFTELNNVLSGFIEVVESSKKVALLFNDVNPDIGAFSCSISQDEYELELVSFDDFKPEKEYDLLVFFGMPQGRKWSKEILNGKKFSSVNSLFFISVGQGKELSKNIGLSINQRAKEYNLAQGIWNEKFDLFQLPQNELERVSEFPPVQVPYGEYVMSNRFKVMAYQSVGRVQTDFPLICFQQNENRRVGVVIGQGYWRWPLQEVKSSDQGESPVFDALMRKIVKYLTVEVNNEKLFLDMKTNPQQGDRLLMKARLYNQVNERELGAKVLLSLKGEGQQEEYTMNLVGNDYVVDVGELAPGTYTVQVRAEINGVISKLSRKFIVQPLLLEQRVLVADHLFLRNVAHESGGRFYLSEERMDLVDHLNRKEYQVKSYLEYFTKSLMMFKWLLFVLVFLLGFEWFLRKWNGAI